MKSLSTIVADIYALLESGKAKLDTVKLSEMLAFRIGEKSGSGPALRMSNIGEKCMRKLWYRANLPEVAEAVPGHTRLKFLTGDIKEELTLSLSEQAGHEVLARGETVEFEGVKGHVDAIIDGTIIDVKSANSRSMEKFRRHYLEWDDPFGYLDQISLYAQALEGDHRVRSPSEVAFIAVDKELGHIVLDIYPIRQRDWKSVISSIRKVLTEPEPKRYWLDDPDGKSGNRQLPMPCRYCEFKEHCWRDANSGQGLKKFIYSHGPRWLTKVMRTPNVEAV